MTGTKDTRAVHYGADGTLIHATCFGTINDNDSRAEAILATPDGGYIIASNQSGMMLEDERLAEGYDWGSYGGEDAVLLKYDAEDRLVWTENYGTAAGDWINALALRDGELIAVGESNGSGGYPAWNNNGGGVDGIILCTGLYSAAYTESTLTADDGDVVWADGTYTDEGTGHAGVGSVTVTVEIAEGAIASVTGVNSKDTDTYYDSASTLHSAIKKAQSVEVDAVSGATHSSDGIKEAARKALSRSAAAHVDALTDAVADEESARAAASAYAELGSYAISCLTKLDALEAAAERYGVTLVSRVPQPITENEPARASHLAYNDAYYKLQRQSFALIGAEAFKRSGLGGEGVRIAVLDSGVTGRHSDLDYSRILDGYDYDGDREMPADALLDNNGHGTAVTGILAAKTGNALGVAGLLDRVEIIPLKISPKAPDKDSDGASSRLVARAIREAVDTYGADVITTSLEIKETDELNEAVAYAVSKNVIITAASGNSGKADSLEDAYVYPAACEGVVSVGAVEASGMVRTSSTKNDTVFVTAPGGDVVLLDLSLSGRCKIAGGTSYASPIVAAMAAAAKQRNKDMTVDEFKELLRQTAVDAGETGYDNAYGYGIVSLSALAEKLTPQSVDDDDGGGSGSGSASSNTTVTTNADGSVIRTVTAADGSAVSTNTTADGTTAKLYADPSGTLVKAEATVSAKAVKTAQKTGAPIRLPLTLPVSKSGTTLVVTLPKSAAGRSVGAMPEVALGLAGGSSGTVAYRKNADGTLTLIKECREELTVPVEDSCELVIADNSKTFSDVTDSAWYADSVRFVAAREIFNGDGQRFYPNETMTRAMAAQILYNYDRNSVPGDGTVFDDVRPADWFCAAVGWAAANGIVNGYGGGFGAAESVARQDLVTILYRYARFVGYPMKEGASLDAYSDADTVSDYARDAMRWAVGIGIINGINGALAPTAPAERAQVAAMIQRFVNNIR